MEDSLKDDYIAALHQDMETVQAQNWKYVLQIADMANQIEDLEILNRAMGLELDYLQGHRDARTP